jgi:S-adenosylmethionine hydrolase
VAAWLSKAGQTNAFGEEIEDYMRFDFPKPKADGEAIKGIILRVDVFGNLLTNISAEDVPALAAADGKFEIRVGKTKIGKLAQTFADGPAGEAIALIGSSGFLEVAVNKGNAARTLGVNRGAEVTVELS